MIYTDSNISQTKRKASVDSLVHLQLAISLPELSTVHVTLLGPMAMQAGMQRSSQPEVRNAGQPLTSHRTRTTLSDQHSVPRESDCITPCLPDLIPHK